MLGTWLEVYVQGMGLHYLGSKFTRPATTSLMVRNIKKALENAQDLPASSWSPIVCQSADLLCQMLEPQSQSRIQASDILTHPFLQAPKETFEGYDHASAAHAAFKRGLLGPSSLSPKASQSRTLFRGL